MSASRTIPGAAAGAGSKAKKQTTKGPSKPVGEPAADATKASSPSGKPDKAAFEKEQEALTAQIEALQKKNVSSGDFFFQVPRHRHGRRT
jgi:hypothetical protein